MIRRPALLSLWLLLLPMAAAALPEDRSQPIEVEADRLEVREKDNISIYHGNVKLRQGSLAIDADRLEISFDDLRDIELMRMTGTPARFRQLDDDNQELLGRAERIDYRQDSSWIELFGDARFERAGDVIESEHIRVNSDSQEIEAGGEQSEERVRMLIQPRGNDATAE